MGTGRISRRVYLSSFSWNNFGSSVAANILLPWKSHFGQLLTRTVHQEVNVIESKTPETDDQAVLYVHWPYCAKRCTYCNFNKYVSESVDHERMAQCLETETRTLLKLSGVKQINSIFFGGGTPSLALPSTIERVINTVRDKVTFKPGSEVTLEANPTKLETERLRDFKTVGVNRVSVGVQALNQNHLNLLGREHTVEQSISCVEKARELYPGRVSVDVIFGRPKQTLEDWRTELHRVLSFCDDHISLYQLTLETGTPLYRWVKQKQCELPDSDTMADLYSEAIQILGDHGFERYEVSNFARNGAQCSHNWAYWRGMQYIGVGPGAHGRFSIQDGGGPREARIQTLLPDTWMTEVENLGHGTRKSEPLANQQRLEEMVILGLRTIEGIPSSRWNRLSKNQDLISVFGNSEKVKNMVENNLLYLDESGLRASSQGLMVLDSIIAHLLNVLEKNITGKGEYSVQLRFTSPGCLCLPSIGSDFLSITCITDSVCVYPSIGSNFLRITCITDSVCVYPSVGSNFLSITCITDSVCVYPSIGSNFLRITCITDSVCVYHLLAQISLELHVLLTVFVSTHLLAQISLELHVLLTVFVSTHLLAQISLELHVLLTVFVSTIYWLKLP